MPNSEATPHHTDAAAARALACMIEHAEPEPPHALLPQSGNVQDVLTAHGNWVIGVLEHVDQLPSFGEYVSCQPTRRCLDCTSWCATESLVVEINRQTSKNVLLLSAGSTIADPSWLRAELFVSGRPQVSGVAFPQLNHDGDVEFAFPATGLLVRPTRNGVSVFELATPSAEISYRTLVFRARLAEVRRAIIAQSRQRHAAAKAVR